MDLASFINHIRTNMDGLENAKIALIGRSYAGTLVTWFRQKYPHLVTVAWASSGPLKAQYDFHGKTC